MIPLPEWVKPYLFDRPCPFCHSDKRPEWVCGLGIRETKQIGKSEMQKGNIGLCFEYLCPDCGRYSTTVVDPDDSSVTFEHMAKEILRAVKGNISGIKTGPSSKISLSRISKKEVEDMCKKLEGMSHEDFMRYIGVPQNQIEKYKKADPEDNKSAESQ